MPHWPKKMVSSDGIKDLSRMEALLSQLGNPHFKLPPIIHIAGTNGKGSTCAMLKAIYMHNGYKVHKYTSPHLINFNERIEICGNKIDDDFLFYFLEKVRMAAEKIMLEPTFFEATTAAAFLAFSEVEADILILETGLGGRLDPTNIVVSPLLTIITPISYDHMEYLGRDIRLITSEKAGIIKDAVPCIIARQDSEVMDLLLERCEQLKCPAIAYEYDYIPEKNENGFLFRSRLGDAIIENLPLIGDHQIINASCAIMASFVASKLDDKLAISIDKIGDGILKTEWPGRLQKFDISKIIGKTTNNICYIDGAHNIAGAAALANWLNSEELTGRPILIVGLTKNRDVASFLMEFQELEPIIYGVRVLSEPSSYSGEKLCEKAKESNIFVEAKDSLEEAFLAAVEEDDNATIIICGSLFLVADCFLLKQSF